MAIIAPKIAYQLDDVGNGNVVCAKGDGTLIAIVDAAVTSKPEGTIDASTICTLQGPFLVYQPTAGGTKFYLLPQD